MHWLNRQGLYKHFVANRVTKAKVHKVYIKHIKWYYVPTKQNPADIIGSRDRLLTKNPDIWWKGPSWIAENNKWSDQPILSEEKESEK